MEALPLDLKFKIFSFLYNIQLKPNPLLKGPGGRRPVPDFPRVDATELTIHHPFLVISLVSRELNASIELYSLSLLNILNEPELKVAPFRKAALVAASTERCLFCLVDTKGGHFRHVFCGVFSWCCVGCGKEFLMDIIDITKVTNAYLVSEDLIRWACRPIVLSIYRKSEVRALALNVFAAAAGTRLRRSKRVADRYEFWKLTMNEYIYAAPPYFCPTDVNLLPNLWEFIRAVNYKSRVS